MPGGVVPRRRPISAPDGSAHVHRSERLSALVCSFFDTRTDLVEARALYASCGFIEIPPAATTPGPFQDHWFEKP